MKMLLSCVDTDIVVLNWGMWMGLAVAGGRSEEQWTEAESN